jgi:hypothetical protein
MSPARSAKYISNSSMSRDARLFTPGRGEEPGNLSKELVAQRERDNRSTTVSRCARALSMRSEVWLSDVGREWTWTRAAWALPGAVWRSIAGVRG